jgi:purine nucleoside phosphorylase
MGMRVLAISTVTNLALADTGVPEEPDHEEVLRTAAAAAGRLTTLLHDVVAQMR